jgi:hypothetical protein
VTAATETPRIVAPMPLAHYLTATSEVRDPDDAVTWYRFAVGNGPSVAIISRGEVLACAGALIPWAGVAELWLALPPAGLAQLPKVYRVLRRLLDDFVDEYKIHRLTADARADDPKAARFLWHFGFARESVMRRHGPNREDFARYVLLPGLGAGL